LQSGAEIDTAFLEPFLDQNDHFTKTGSGQTWENTPKRRRFSQGRYPRSHRSGTDRSVRRDDEGQWDRSQLHAGCQQQLQCRAAATAEPILLQGAESTVLCAISVVHNTGDKNDIFAKTGLGQT
jgi:hypothetical protein